ncbi:MAG: acyl-ACP thioesterase [Treponema sp.]|jgi:acyl-ACP thioesterase|nr:acyl-ACP thioesterase [Treponema sp.]
MNCNPANPKESGIVNIWQETYPVRFGAIDRSDRLTLNAMFQFFQEAAICHAENLNVGREDMARTGQLWILSRMSVIVDRRPAYRETITVRSWPRGGEKLFAVRDYDIRDDVDVPVVSARSGWIILDVEKRRPLRPQSVMDSLPQNEGADALSASANAIASLEERGNLQKTAERKVRYTDLDYNGHVNNVRYIQWIEDSLDPQVLENANKIRFDINYLNEILDGEIVEIMSARIEDNTCADAFAFEGRKQENGQAAFRAELRLHEIH